MNDVIKTLLKTIEDSGFKAYLVGGYVRDNLLGFTEENLDLDVVTDAPKDVILKLFNEYKPKALKYDTISFKYFSYSVDIARMRSETYSNNQLSVEFVNDLEKDAQRRDFSINAIYYDCSSNYIDFFNGLLDIKNKNIKFIGIPDERLIEDPSRLLRYIYFIVKYDLIADNEEFDEVKRISKDILSKMNKLDINKYVSRILNLGKYKSFCDILIKLDIYYELFQDEFKPEYDSRYSFVVGTKYKYSKLLKSSDQSMIQDISTIVNEGYIGMDTLFFYSMDIVIEASKVIGYNVEDLQVLFNKMCIHNKNEVNISKMEIAHLLNSPIDENVNKIYNKVVHNILYGELENDKFRITEYIRRRDYDEQ